MNGFAQQAYSMDNSTKMSEEVMNGFDPDMVAVYKTLVSQFAVFDSFTGSAGSVARAGNTTQHFASPSTNTGGSEGLFARKTLEITDEILSTYRNQGGYDLLGLKLDDLVIIGGVTSNKQVVGVPVTLNEYLKNQFVEINVGFDTICKVNSQLISNVCTDALSAEKASHVALECTLQSHPNMKLVAM
ncbi:hypothetical protein OROGR_015871 [Orobanche gracilis]